MKEFNNKMELSHKQRFDVSSVGNAMYAALTLGCPSMTVSVDRSVFKKTLQEKFTVFGFKKELGKSKNHKFKTIFQGSF